MSTNKVAPEPSPTASQETGKKRASRIALDYFKHRTGLERWKNRLALVCLLLAGGYVAYVVAADPRAVSRGPVANVHAAWDSNCQACHDNFSGVGVERLWGVSVPHGSSDAKCQTCHEGTIHHQTATDGVSCGGCHRDHRGRDASLVRLADSDCTSCHANLDLHMKAGEKPAYHHEPDHKYANTITSFAVNHPPFDLPKEDPGNVKFNHAKHLQPGQEAEWMLDDIKKDDPVAFLRYKSARPQREMGDSSKGDKAFVVLDCASCHVLDAGDAGGKGTKASGAYYLPVSFDANCKACHGLSFDKEIKTTITAADGKAVSVYRQAPHGVQPSDIDAFLWGVFANAYLGDDKSKLTDALTGQHQPSRPLPGKGAAAAKQDIDQQVERARQDLVLGLTKQKRRIVNNSCAKCHFFDDPAKPQRVKPSNIPVVWETHAKFNHVSHRAMECISCHEKAYPYEADGKTLKSKEHISTGKHDVMLPAIAKCQECHSPAGGVRHDCTGCHNYHNGDHAAQGVGAASRNPTLLLNSVDFLGARKK